MASRRPARAGGAGNNAAFRGALLIAAAVILGAVLLAQGFSDNGSSPTSSGPSTTVKHSSTPPSSTPASISQAHDPAQVKVLVLNGSGKSGVAKTVADALKAANYTTLDPGNAKGGTVSQSVVYYVPGYDVDAANVATKLGLPATAVQAMPSPVPASVGDPQDANVVVVVGTDAPAAGGSSTTVAPSTTAAPSTTTAN